MITSTSSEEWPEWSGGRQIIVPSTETQHEAVRVVQRCLRIPDTGVLDEGTAAAVRGIQRLFNRYPSGVLDRETMWLFDGLRWS